ncbi:MAG: transglutaminase-like domain-containing protein [Candidatus Micrarchaeia archaeon]|jgi:transglutaminase-like putative cysteine protease
MAHVENLLRPKHLRSAFAIFAFAILFSGFCNAVSPDSTGSSVIHARLEYSIILPNAATQAEFSAYVFGNFTAQSAAFSASDPFEFSTDTFGNSVLTFKYFPTPGTQRAFWIDAMLNTSYDPQRFAFEKSNAGTDYLSQSKLVRINSQISSLGKSIVPAGSDAYAAIQKLSSWVYENIIYDSNYKDSAMDSLSVLNISRGTCDEKAHLLEALLRSQSIPARHAVGFAYSGKEWQPHAWVEAGVNGEWVPIDPTFNELFFIDATHVRLAVGRDQEDTKYSIRAIGTSNLSGTQILPRFNLTFASAQPYSDFFSFAVDFPQGVHSSSERGTIIANVSNLFSNRTIAVPLLLTLHQDFSVSGPAAQIILLKPKESRMVVWDVVFPFKVTGGYIYNYSALVTAYGNERMGFLEASQKGRAEVEKLVLVENVAAAKTDSGLLLSFWVRNTGTTALSSIDVMLSTSSSNQSTRISQLAIGNIAKVEFILPYPAKGVKSLDANISISLGQSSYSSPVSIDLSDYAATPYLPATATNALAGVFYSPIFLAAAAIVIVLTLLIAIIVRKRR